MQPYKGQWYPVTRHRMRNRKKNNSQSTCIYGEGNGCETRQSSLWYVFILFLGLDPAQTQ